MHKMEAFMSEVRDMVVPHLRDEEDRVRAWQPKMVWQVEPYKPHTMVDAMRMAFGDTAGPFGEAYYSDGTPYASRKGERRKTPTEVVLYEHSFRFNLSLPQPFGLMVAFVTIHELGHAVCSCGHNNDVWPALCRTMGIDEQRYDLKQTAGRFAFLDPNFARQIQRMYTYPEALK